MNTSTPAKSLFINPASIPRVKLYTGATMPAIGLGTFGSDHIAAEDIARTILGAAVVGYRHFDCASVYENEPEIGFSLQTVVKSGIRREDIWITSKVWNDKHEGNGPIEACQRSLADLRLDYLDLYLVHWPFPNYHPPHCDVTSRSPNSRPYIHENFMGTWRKMEQLVDMGLVRHIGISNTTIPKLKLLLRDARITPAAIEMELHPHFQQPELFQFVIDNGVQPIGYCPIGSPGRPERDRTREDTSPTRDPVILEIAAHHRISPAEVCIKWAVQRGQVPIPFSIHHYRHNLACIAGDPLSDEEMHAIAAIDRNCRLIKGQVFLWQEGQSWEALWDMNGEIEPA